MRENVDVEFKELDRKSGKLPDSIAKEIIAFANTEGGELYIGIRDDGVTVGVDHPDFVMTMLSNTIHDSILPDLIPFIQIRAIERDGKTVIKTTVAVGTERPYYLAREGLKPRGVFVRRGSACIPLHETGIRQMILETTGKSFEQSRSLNQSLTFSSLQHELGIRNLEFGLPQMKTLKLVGEDGLYTNLALLLSDQCAHTIKVAVFQGRDSAVFRDRKEFSGSVLKQLADVYQFICRFNKTEAAFEGLIRTDTRDYPEEAIREALLNSIIHRDYLFSGSTVINFFDDHLEFISLGGLVAGISMEAVFLGASVSRNPNLAAVFYRLGLVESYGTGIRKIMRLYEHSGMQPSFRTAEGAFAVSLPNRNESHLLAEPAQGHGYAPGGTSAPDQSDISDMKEAICKLIAEKGKATRKDVEGILHIGSTKAYKLLKQLCAEGRLIQKLNGNRTTYRLS